MGVDGIISTFALTLVPEYDQVLRNGSEALTPKGHWVVLDFKLPGNRLATLAPLLVLLTRPFGVRLEMADRRPWEAMKSYLTHVHLTELYGGFVYIAVGDSSGIESGTEAAISPVV